MKKIFLLVFTFAIAGTLLAQGYPDRRESRRVILGENRPVYGNGNYGNYPYSTGSQSDREIARINREYDQKINKVNHRLFVSRAKKRREIRKLEKERDRKIRKIDRRSSRGSLFSRNL
jgi:hypothetical protein